MNNFEFKKDVELKEFSTFHIGGKAKFLYIAHSNMALINVCSYSKSHNIKYKVIGLGANLLFDDLGYNGLIVVNRSNKILFRKNCVYVDGGCNLSVVIFKCLCHSLGGLENLISIPSTIAGAVTNSLGAFDVEFFNFVEYVECCHISNLNKKLKLNKNQCKFGYRTSLFKNNEYIITRVKLVLNYDNKENIIKHINKATEKKASTQPLSNYSAGSVFKRGNLVPAKVIDELGLKGTTIGGAQISTKHSGFIINTGLATSNDVKRLIDLIKNKVKSAYDEDLDIEIEIVSF